MSDRGWTIGNRTRRRRTTTTISRIDDTDDTHDNDDDDDDDAEISKQEATVVWSRFDGQRDIEQFAKGSEHYIAC